MPINACSINTYSVDAVCSSKRTKYIDMLWGNTPPQPVTVRGHGGFTALTPQFNTDDEYKVNRNNIELPYITISVTLNGETVEQTYENSPWQLTPMITINNISSTPSEIKLGVSNFKIGQV